MKLLVLQLAKLLTLSWKDKAKEMVTMKMKLQDTLKSTRTVIFIWMVTMVMKPMPDILKEQVEDMAMAMAMMKVIVDIIDAVMVMVKTKVTADITEEATETVMMKILKA